jgi:hypothetical protein
MSIYQTTQANKQKKNAARALNEFERQDLDNAFDDLQISTLGSDYLSEQNQIATAGAVDAAQTGGTRAIVGALPGIVAANNNANREGQIYLDDQAQRRDYATAGDEIRIQGMQEQRDNADLSGLGTAIQTARQDEWSGMRGMFNSLGYMSNNIPERARPAQDSVDVSGGPGVTPMGIPLPTASTVPLGNGNPQYNAWNNIDYSKFKYGF